MKKEPLPMGRRARRRRVRIASVGFETDKANCRFTEPGKKRMFAGALTNASCRSTGGVSLRVPEEEQARVRRRMAEAKKALRLMQEVGARMVDGVLQVRG